MRHMHIKYSRRNARDLDARRGPFTGRLAAGRGRETMRVVNSAALGCAGFQVRWPPECAGPPPPPAVAPAPRRGGMLAGNLHYCTDALQPVQECHLVSYFEVRNGTPSAQRAICKSKRHQSIGEEGCVLQRFKNPGGTAHPENETLRRGVVHQVVRSRIRRQGGGLHPTGTRGCEKIVRLKPDLLCAPLRLTGKEERANVQNELGWKNVARVRRAAYYEVGNANGFFDTGSE